MTLRRTGEPIRIIHTTPLATWTLALACLALAAASPARAGGDHALFIIDANTGATLANQDGTDPRYPASLTKMMTIYMAFDAVQRGTTTMNSPVKFSLAATKAAPSKLDLDVGDTITLENAILALITKSANDVAIAVAEHLGGTEPNFAKMMTAKAREIGMKNTTFKNASGLPDGDQTTTARDMTTLGLRLYDDFPKQFPLFATRSFAYNGSSYRNHNTLMLQMPGINGIKTGYTHASGFNLVSSLQQDGKHVIGAIFGGTTANSRNLSMRIALAKAIGKASTQKTRKPVLVAQATPAKPAARAPAPAPVAAAAPKANPPATAPAPAPAPVVVADATPKPAPLRIDIAKVRPATAQETATVAPPVSVAAATPPPRAPEPERAPPPAFAQASSAPRLADVVKPKAPAPAAAVAPVVPAPPAPPAGVRPPSSLNAQLAQLSQSAGQAPAPPTQPSYRLNGPAQQTQPTLQKVANASAPVNTASTTSLNYDIQIGAYASPAEADRRMTSAVSLVPAHLKNRRPNRQQVSVGDKTLYRARFSGFDQSAAAAACAELNRQSINCIALKSE